ncbi:uncharacterized protein LOC117644283 [Thrips palmi]|uniref:Uncharacterized protein LOC117644283 n=1 Tax=Thrips palmi TaxID=161013 RepID=A0A6P8YQC8_THRPL|nr:uncharacterized protein LOC117644283 [Thrips palmi]
MMTWTVVMLFSSLTLVSSSNNVAGPYYLDILEFGNCPPDEVGEVGDDLIVDGAARHHRGLKHMLFSGNLTVKNGLVTPGISELTSYIGRWDPVSGWKDNFLVLRIGETCQAIRKYAPPFKDLIHKAFPGIPIRCPVGDRYSGQWAMGASQSCSPSTSSRLPSAIRMKFLAKFGRLEINVIASFLSSSSSTMYLLLSPGPESVDESKIESFTFQVV